MSIALRRKLALTPMTEMERRRVFFLARVCPVSIVSLRGLIARTERQRREMDELEARIERLEYESRIEP